MKDRYFLMAAVLSMILLFGGIGCVSAERGDELEGEKPSGVLRTKSDIYMHFGIPEEIRVVGDDLYLFYILKKEMGSEFGIGTPAANFSIGRNHLASDTFIFVIDPQGRVKTSNFLRGTNILRRSVWPFGT
ncbi:MAG: hypothetical protein ACYTG7_12125 [Planctomycetota bacterium]|jgi:hypothetical protein